MVPACSTHVDSRMIPRQGLDQPLRGSAMTSTSAKEFSSSLRCMEIRGGSRSVEESFDTPGLDAWIFSRPFEGADSGGDLHYVSLCGGGLITRLVIADVSGHGAQVSGFSTVLRDLMRKNINTKDQTRLVEALNRQFGEMAQLQRFATAVVATYLANRRSLTVCNAGHPRPSGFGPRQVDGVCSTGTRPIRATCHWASTTSLPITSSRCHARCRRSRDLLHRCLDRSGGPLGPVTRRRGPAQALAGARPGRAASPGSGSCSRASNGIGPADRRTMTSRSWSSPTTPAAPGGSRSARSSTSTRRCSGSRRTDHSHAMN